MRYPENTQAAVELIEKFARFASNSVARAKTEFGMSWQNDFEILLARLYSTPAALEAAIKGYGSFAIDSMRRQKRFEREGTYPAKTFEQASQEVYLNAEHMTEQYLPGLLLSHYLWGHHYRQIEYFKTFVLPALRAQQTTDFVEVGVGTGIYSRIALEENSGICGVGYEISPLSMQFAQRHLTAYGLSHRYSMELRDILVSPPERRFQWVFCVEVLEHMEDPVALLRALKNLAVPGGKLFVTAALNAAHADHIYLYRKPQDVLDQVAEAGLNVEHHFFSNAYVPERPGLAVPGALAMVLSS